MFCSACGLHVAQGLSYCNYCGAKLGGAEAVGVVQSPEIKPESLVFSMVSVFVLGLLAITILIGVMKAVLGLDVRVILAFTLLSFLIMLMVEGVFIRLLLGRKRASAGATGEPVRLQGQATKELDAARAQLPPEPATSVTEGTTRAFEPLYQERTAK